MEDFGKCSVSTISNGHATVTCLIHKREVGVDCGVWGVDYSFACEYWYELKRDGKTVYKTLDGLKSKFFLTKDDALTDAENTVFAGDFKDVKE